jgi:hypothetical protein
VKLNANHGLLKFYYIYTLKYLKNNHGRKALRNHSVATEVEAAPLDSESCRDSNELDCNVVGGETLGNKGSRSSSCTLPTCKEVMK